MVRVRVNEEKGEIEWLVDENIRASHQTDKLKDREIKWAPMIKFFDQGDCIEWIKND